ncbi:MAG: hypothetical protein KVP17_001411 [Porospora cf. gigantea B]|uniref:uncharacterized protein n=1 Tax=Porospora cf. gigantea B TaxID=2853592 RepID=UPI003571C13E|nr:MAG: hypothetical protein KVP17_001411 [Porospora cf. gigantea B]
MAFYANNLFRTAADKRNPTVIPFLFPSSDSTNNPLNKELLCSQPASLLRLSAQAIQQSPKIAIKDVLREIPTHLKEVNICFHRGLVSVLKTTDTSPQWKQILSEDYSKTAGADVTKQNPNHPAGADVHR